MHNTTVFCCDFKRFIQLQIYISIRGEWQGLGTCRYYRIIVINPSFSSGCPKEAEHPELICRLITYSQKHIWFDLSHWGLVIILQFDQQKVISCRYHSLVRESFTPCLIGYHHLPHLSHNSYSSTAFFRLNLLWGWWSPCDLLHDFKCFDYQVTKFPLPKTSSGGCLARHSGCDQITIT